MSLAEIDAYLKAPCARKRCAHSRGYHLGFAIPSNISSAYVLTLKGGACNHPNCFCAEFVESEGA